MEGRKAVAKVAQVCLPLARVTTAFIVRTDHVDHVYQGTHRTEHLIPLCVHIAVHIRCLTTAIPQVEHKIPRESHMRMFDVNGTAKAFGVFRSVRREDKRPHRSLARSGLSHQKDLCVSGLKDIPCASLSSACSYKVERRKKTMARRPSGYVEITWHGLSSSPPASPATTCRWGRGARCRGQSADELCPF